ncbi:MAG: cupredoxin domain-containing protein, partial [Microcoleus sp. SIO2G3]|nr:cupredoxin domain-containing protein [Microcoleus sp. SIO2G3]
MKRSIFFGTLAGLGFLLGAMSGALAGVSPA